MRAVVIDKGSLSLRDVPTPEPGPGQARVRIRAAGVNRSDLMQLRGTYPAPPDAPSDIPGLEIAGEVDALGPGVRDVAVGDRVFTIVGGGAYAEQVVVPARSLAPIPDGFDFTRAAAIPEAFLTAYDAMVLQAGLSAGDHLLVHAVGSGVGTAAVQIARAIGATAIGTARTQGKLDRAAALGMKHGVLVDGAGAGARAGAGAEAGAGAGAGAKPGAGAVAGAGAKPAFAAQVRELTGGRGVDVVLELVGGSYLPESLAACAERACVVLVGLMGGASAELSLGPLLHRRLTIIGTVMRTRPLEQKIALGQVLRRNLVPLFASGKLMPIVDRVLPLDKAQEAIEAMASNTTFGKIILEI